MEINKEAHPVINEFSENLHRLNILYKRSYTVLQHLPEEIETGVYKGNSEILQHYNHVFEVYRELNYTYRNLLQGYNKFREAAKEDNKVAEEFHKIPSNFLEVSAQLKGIIENNKSYLVTLEQLL